MRPFYAPCFSKPVHSRNKPGLQYATGQQHVHFTQHQMNSQFYYMQSEYAFPSHCNINRAQKPLLIAYLYVTIT